MVSIDGVVTARDTIEGIEMTSLVLVCSSFTYFVNSVKVKYIQLYHP